MHIAPNIYFWMGRHPSYSIVREIMNIEYILFLGFNCLSLCWCHELTKTTLIIIIRGKHWYRGIDALVIEKPKDLRKIQNQPKLSSLWFFAALHCSIIGCINSRPRPQYLWSLEISDLDGITTLIFFELQCPDLIGLFYYLLLLQVLINGSLRYEGKYNTDIWSSLPLNFLMLVFRWLWRLDS